MNSAYIGQLKKYKFRLFLLLPALILVFVFSYVPMLGIIIAFQDFDIIEGFFGSKFVGLSNFVKIFTIPQFLAAIKNTLIFSGVNLIFSTPFPIILALLFNELKHQKFKKLVQTVSYMPHFLSWISVVGMFYMFFSTDGTFNDIRENLFGLERTNILLDSKYFLGIVFTSNLWKTVGWSSVIYLAAIAGIDGNMYDAATIDGCGRFGQIFYITLPSIMPTIIILFIMATGSLVNSNFEQIFGFQNIYTQEATEVINTIVYRKGILDGQYSLSTALGLLQGAVSFIIVFLSNMVIKKLTGTGIW